MARRSAPPLLRSSPAAPPAALALLIKAVGQSMRFLDGSSLALALRSIGSLQSLSVRNDRALLGPAANHHLRDHHEAGGGRLFPADDRSVRSACTQTIVEKLPEMAAVDIVACLEAMVLFEWTPSSRGYAATGSGRSGSGEAFQKQDDDTLLFHHLHKTFMRSLFLPIASGGEEDPHSRNTMAMLTRYLTVLKQCCTESVFASLFCRTLSADVVVEMMLTVPPQNGPSSSSAQIDTLKLLLMLPDVLDIRRRYPSAITAAASLSMPSPAAVVALWKLFLHGNASMAPSVLCWQCRHQLSLTLQWMSASREMVDPPTAATTSSFSSTSVAAMMKLMPNFPLALPAGNWRLPAPAVAKKTRICTKCGGCGGEEEVAADSVPSSRLLLLHSCLLVAKAHHALLAAHGSNDYANDLWQRSARRLQMLLGNPSTNSSGGVFCDVAKSILRWRQEQRLPMTPSTSFGSYLAGIALKRLAVSVSGCKSITELLDVCSIARDVAVVEHKEGAVGNSRQVQVDAFALLSAALTQVSTTVLMASQPGQPLLSPPLSQILQELSLSAAAAVLSPGAAPAASSCEDMLHAPKEKLRNTVKQTLHTVLSNNVLWKQCVQPASMTTLTLMHLQTVLIKLLSTTTRQFVGDDRSCALDVTDLLWKRLCECAELMAAVAVVPTQRGTTNHHTAATGWTLNSLFPHMKGVTTQAVATTLGMALKDVSKWPLAGASCSALLLRVEDRSAVCGSVVISFLNELERFCEHEIVDHQLHENILSPLKTVADHWLRLLPSFLTVAFPSSNIELRKGDSGEWNWHGIAQRRDSERGQGLLERQHQRNAPTPDTPSKIMREIQKAVERRKKKHKANKEASTQLGGHSAPLTSATLRAASRSGDSDAVVFLATTVLKVQSVLLRISSVAPAGNHSKLSNVIAISHVTRTWTPKLLELLVMNKTSWSFKPHGSVLNARRFLDIVRFAARPVGAGSIPSVFYVFSDYVAEQGSSTKQQEQFIHCATLLHQAYVLRCDRVGFCRSTHSSSEDSSAPTSVLTSPSQQYLLFRDSPEADEFLHSGVMKKHIATAAYDVPPLPPDVAMMSVQQATPRDETLLHLSIFFQTIEEGLVALHHRTQRQMTKDASLPTRAASQEFSTLSPSFVVDELLEEEVVQLLDTLGCVSLVKQHCHPHNDV